MDQIDLLAQWIIDNQSAKGTADFDVVVAAYEELRDAPAEEAVYDYGGDRPVFDAFMPYRRKVLQEEQNLPTGQISFDTRGRMQQEIQNVPAKYGPAEYDLSYMPLVRGVKQAGEFLGDVFLGSNEEKAAAGEAVVSMAKAIPSMLTGQIEAANSETGVVYNPETGSMTEFDPFLALAGSSGLTRMPAAVTETGRMIRSARDSVSNIPERIRRYESPRAIEAAENMRGGGMTATRDSTAGYRLEEVIDGSNPEIPRLPAPSNSPDGAPDYITNGKKYKAAKDPVQKAAVRQGFDAGLVTMIREASPSDRRKMLQSLSITKESVGNKRYGLTARSGDVIGDSILERYKLVQDVNNRSGAEIDVFAEANMANTFVDFRSTIERFKSDLGKMKIKLSDNGNLDFSLSSIKGLSGIENYLSRIAERMRSQRRMTAEEVHQFKRFIDDQTRYGKTEEGLSGRAKSIVGDLRRNLDDLLDNKYPEYDRLNSTYSESIRAIDDLEVALGRTINLDERRANNAVGIAARSVGAQRTSKARLMNALEDIDTLAKKYGGAERFDNDVLNQASFVFELDKIFGTQAPTSLASVITQGVDKAGLSTTGAVTAAGKFAIDKLLGLDQAKQFRAMEELLKSFD
tara:strand:+ start:1309 stop:3195 length:1887 start_codon:yes stop_codon:yes gene_type:complete